MAETIRVGLAGPSEGADLVRMLAAQGLPGRLIREAGRWEVEIGSEHEETERLLSDVLAALETWLGEREPSSIRVRVGGRTYAFPQGHVEGAANSATWTRGDDPFSAGSRPIGSDEDDDLGVRR